MRNHGPVLPLGKPSLLIFSWVAASSWTSNPQSRNNHAAVESFPLDLNGSMPRRSRASVPGVHHQFWLVCLIKERKAAKNAWGRAPKINP